MSEHHAYIERNSRVTAVMVTVCSTCGHTVVKDTVQPKTLDNDKRKV
jgi:ribosomal protein L32